MRFMPGRRRDLAFAGKSWIRSRHRPERVTGIEPAQSAWEAETLPLSYTRERVLGYMKGPQYGACR